jgi:hypothetical protein
MKTRILILTVALSLPASLALAQRPGGPGGPPPPPPGPPPGQQPPNQRPPRDGDQPREPLPPPVAPLEHALDTDDDGIISASEIEHSPDSLAKLDKNNDGKLSREELAPRPPEGANPEGDRPRTRNTVSDKNLPPAPFPGQRPPRDGDAPKAGPRDGDAPKPGVQGDAPKPGTGAPREGDQNRPKQPPLLNALDANHDGVISAAEIADAPNALATLDKNNDGQLGPREYQPRPPGDHKPATPPPVPTTSSLR